MKILYFDCFSGISGDMIIGSLLDLGLNFKFLENDKIKVQEVIKEVVELVSMSHELHVPLQYKVETLSSVKKTGSSSVRGRPGSGGDRQDR